MATDRVSIDSLRSRVEKHGHKLVTADFDETGRTGLYVLDPHKNELVIVSAGSEDLDRNEVEGWLKQRENAEVNDVATVAIGAEAPNGNPRKLCMESGALQLAVGVALDRIEAVARMFVTELLEHADGQDASVAGLIADEAKRANEMLEQIRISGQDPIDAQAAS